MNILLVEDRTLTITKTADALAEENYIVRRECSIVKAKEVIIKSNLNIDYWKIDVIVADLNMDFTGLDEKWLPEIDGAQLTGWIWLVNDVFQVSDNKNIDVVIYSGFLHILNKRIEAYQHLPKEYFTKEMESEISLYNKSKLISKESNILDHRRLINALRQIESERNHKGLLGM